MNSRFRNPGHAFIEQYEAGLPTCLDSLTCCVTAYVDFLRVETQQQRAYCIDVDAIFHSFGHKKRAINSGNGEATFEGAVQNEFGLVLINEDDPVTRQRFTAAHELMENLIWALQCNNLPIPVQRQLEGDSKERLCNIGASELLMPRNTFLPLLPKGGVSIGTGQRLAKRFQTSLLATLRRIVKCYRPQDVALIIWHLGHRRQEKIKLRQTRDQIALFPGDFSGAGPKRLRVHWVHFPEHLRLVASTIRNKSIQNDSLIGQVFEDGKARQGEEFVRLVKLKGMCKIDARRVTIGGERSVISLFQLPSGYSPDKYTPPPVFP